MFWMPSLSRRSYSPRPEVGALIGLDFRAWRVERVEDVHPGDWSDEIRSAWVAAGSPDPWARAPFRVVVTPAQGGKEHMATIDNPYRAHAWHILPEHYAVCVKCGDLAPCRESIEADRAEREVRRAVAAMSVPDGACPACKEVITRRQKSHYFPGDNLLNPLGSPGVRFHARRKCQSAAAAYEEKWVAADPSRERSPLTLRCSGNVAVHADGTAECHGRNDGSECPHIYAHHRSYTACYLMSHGCPRGCSPGHGCNPGPGLAADGSLDRGVA